MELLPFWMSVNSKDIGDINEYIKEIEFLTFWIDTTIKEISKSIVLTEKTYNIKENVSNNNY